MSISKKIKDSFRVEKTKRPWGGITYLSILFLVILGSCIYAVNIDLERLNLIPIDLLFYASYFVFIFIAIKVVIFYISKSAHKKSKMYKYLKWTEDIDNYTIFAVLGVLFLFPLFTHILALEYSPLPLSFKMEQMPNSIIPSGMAWSSYIVCDNKNEKKGEAVDGDLIKCSFRIKENASSSFKGLNLHEVYKDTPIEVIPLCDKEEVAICDFEFMLEGAGYHKYQASLRFSTSEGDNYLLYSNIILEVIPVEVYSERGGTKINILIGLIFFVVMNWIVTVYYLRKLIKKEI